MNFRRQAPRSRTATCEPMIPNLDYAKAHIFSSEKKIARHMTKQNGHINRIHMSGSYFSTSTGRSFVYCLLLAKREGQRYIICYFLSNLVQCEHFPRPTNVCPLVGNHLSVVNIKHCTHCREKAWSQRSCTGPVLCSAKRNSSTAPHTDPQR